MVPRILKMAAIAGHVEVLFSIPVVTKYTSQDTDTNRIYIRAYLKGTLNLYVNKVERKNK